MIKIIKLNNLFLFRTLKESCGLSYISYVFDNKVTVVYSFFMSLWGKLFKLNKKIANNSCWYFCVAHTIHLIFIWSCSTWITVFCPSGRVLTAQCTRQNIKSSIEWLGLVWFGLFKTKRTSNKIDQITSF